MLWLDWFSAGSDDFLAQIPRPRGRTMKPQSWIVLKPQTSVVPTFNTGSVRVRVSVQGVDASATFPGRAEALSSEDMVLGMHRVSRVRVVICTP